MQPYVEHAAEFQFATPLKEFCIKVLGLTRNQCYGTSADRETPTKYTWGDIDPEIRNKYDKDPSKHMTAREVLQVFGTDLMRNKFYRNIWAEAGVRAAVDGDSAISVITDSRFPNELEITRDADFLGPDFRRSIIVRLYRDTGLTDDHDSETALDKYDAYPQQNRIDQEAIDAMCKGAYEQLTDTLWASKYTRNTYDYLIDNNSTLDRLTGDILTILVREDLFVKPSLS